MLPANPVPVEFCFAPTQTEMPSAVSRFVKTDFTEGTETPVYYQYKKITWNGCEYLAVYYVLFFTMNPGYRPFKLCGLGKPMLGRHPGDVERLTVLFEGNDLSKPVWVYFGAHGSGQGEWTAWDKCEKTSDGALRVYVSPTSHALYPRAARYFRIFGFANDVTSKKGKKWRPADKDFVNAHTQSWSNSHYQVVRGINSPKNVGDPAESSITPRERFLFGIPAVMKKVRAGKKVLAIPFLE